ncbi:DUF3857 domain-containing protein [Filimonas effusa]|uniref:DUF3857 domain-containing protein n=1 Tax=Filimonas effusa TaxID=2508721 RepID=A0A4Q1D4A6_9BACT|nr:DUF3857 domain-containing protein [Filimonas effusa]RXK83270.1 DUF3857 domain-containing protein [Filimonas effusa]
MNRILCTVGLLLCFATAALAQNDNKSIWEALNNGDRQKATTLLQEALQNKTITPDQYLTYIYLKEYNGKDDEATDFIPFVYDKIADPSPYVYALWFNMAALGQYGKKNFPHQVKLMEKLLTDSKAHGSLVSATHYQKAMHLISSNQFEAAEDEFRKLGAIANWQYVGPFENLSYSGYYKNFGPQDHPEADAVFTSLTNANIKWFVPALEANVGWTPVCYQTNRRTATVYAQTFVDAPAAQEVLLSLGSSGATKVWVNDELIISEYKERVTELDCFTTKAKLKQGANRILVQVSFTGNSSPCFIIRLTDDKFNAIPGLQGGSTYKPYTVVKATGTPAAPRTHFAEKFFSDKIAADSNNLVNYLLLSNTYLRNNKLLEARHVAETALQRAPANCLLRMNLLSVLLKEENRSVMLEELEKLKKADPQSYLTLEVDIKTDINNEKYEEALKKVITREQLYGQDEETLSYRISLLAQEKKYEELIATVEAGYKKYPQLESLLPMMYSIKKEVNKDPKGALKVYETFLKNGYSYTVVNKYAELLKEQGQSDKSFQQKQFLQKIAPYDPAELIHMSNYFYGEKKYDKAEQFVKQALDLSPYDENYWEQLGDIKSEKKQTEEAIAAYEKSLLYDPNQYTVINKIRKLNGKSETYTLFPQTDIEATIKKDKPEEAKNTDYGYYILHDEKNVVMHPGGATEEYILFMIKITNEKGIDKYKESSIGYGNSQQLLIEKAEVVKASGATIKGERNGNEVVFTNLGVGDVLVFKYRLQNYVYGRFAKEYWDQFHFDGQIYTAYAKYTLLLPENQPVKYEVVNSTGFKPVISKVENFKQYVWEASGREPLKEEKLAPNNCDVGAVLHISTLPSWNDIATWYRDLTSNTTEEDYEITALFQTLLPAEKRKKLTQFQQARILYDYIENNIRYSSVSFRQSSHVPQRASLTLNTRLGDCKDLSNLFLTLCRMADIECQMVLVDTRDNGEKAMILPSLEFNHCIAKAQLDGKPYYIELTDNYLPFASLPNSLTNALILDIPLRKTTQPAELKYLTTSNRTKDVVKRKVDIKFDGNDLITSVATCRYGHPASGTRATYLNLDEEKQIKEMETSVASSYKNNVKLLSVKFDDLAPLNDSVTYNYSYRVKDEVAEIGSMQTFRIVYPDVVASLNNFAADTRTLPINYAYYEDVDKYETQVTIVAPEGKKFIELPVNESLQFKNISFSIDYKLVTPSKLVVTRKFIADRKTIPAADYVAFKSFFEKIVKAEQKMIAMK